MTLDVSEEFKDAAVDLLSGVVDSLGTLSHRRAVGDLALFYRYTNGLCSSELSSMMPPLDVPARQTRLTLASHPNRGELRTSELADTTALLYRGCLDCGTIYRRKLFPVLLTLGSSKFGLTKFIYINTQQQIHGQSKKYIAEFRTEKFI
ncbi:unnamed protein product [Acanthoscelides obtectus]|uniref:Uncharacterized protein n=1 Tax=Acanthoscelides obtectus TaxID=200917 RepID=A0A9P0PH59_ACAOB|nr:unnamed protein product [Acanthoscelides obtectus]CAK1623410.1 hypothetical protein AOBTE_LOCUS1990 [Acanthoscelides obtectus]